MAFGQFLTNLGVPLNYIPMRKDDLHQLIHSLSKNEKRYVSQFSKLHEKKGENQYKEIFTLLAKIPPEEYDEAQFRNDHTKKPWQKHFPQKKKYLKDLILTAMRLYHRNDKVEKEVEDMLRDQAFLQDRGVYESSQRLLNRAKKIAWENGCTRLLVEINERERNLLLERKSKGVIEELGKSIDEGRQVQQMEAKETRRRELYERCFAEYRFGKKSDRDRSIEYFAEAIELEESTSEPEDSFKAKLDLLLTKAVHARMRSQFEEFHQTYREILALWEGSERMRKENPKRFIKVIANYANSCHTLKLIPELEEQLEKLENFETKDYESEAERFQNLVHLKLLYFLNTKRIEEADQLVNDESKEGIEFGLGHYGSKVNAARRRTITYNCFVLYFILEDFQTANGWLQRMFDESIGEARSDLKALSLILLPVFWYERGDYGLFENYLRSAKYSVKDAKEAAPNKLEEIMVAFLNKLKSKKGDERIVEHANWAMDELRKSYFGEGADRLPLGLEEFMLWLESKIQSKTIREVFEGGSGGLKA
jgi:hypothetical protein